jgi:glycosyltransferase involved in cell wall biosynthesis
MAPKPRRITLVTDELLGYTRTGGIGTATSFLAVALGRMGHRVDLLYVGEPPRSALSAEWARLYEAAGVVVSVLPQSETPVEPSFFARMRDVERALAADPPDVVITQDLAAPAYTAIRMRDLGLAFDKTLFIVYCHGTRRWITDVSRKIRVLPGALGVTLLEQASLELADVVVSPSEYLGEWMKAQGWQLPQSTYVIPHLTRAIATGEPQRRVETHEPIRRIVFFGRLEERKGIAPFIDGINALSADLLQDVEITFLGRATPAWSPDHIRGLLSGHLRASFETNLDQSEALAYLARPGTLAVIPSYAETFGYTVRECLDLGIPFIASDTAAISELIAPEHRAHVLFQPAAEGIQHALSRALSNGDALHPAQAAFDTASSSERWAELVELEPARRDRGANTPTAKIVVGHTGVEQAQSDWIVLLEEGDVPDDDLVDMLADAQAASVADIVTCGVRIGEVERYFLGDPGGLGVLANHYGAIALIRRSLVSGAEERWPLLARLVLDGAKIVSVPRTLATAGRPPRSIDTDSAEALQVIAHFERRLPRSLKSLARLAGGLAAKDKQHPDGMRLRLRLRLRPRSLLRHARSRP